MMKIEIDEGSGFCFGVVRAISRAQELFSTCGGTGGDTGGEVYCLGDIVHNRVEIGRLKDLGLRFVDHNSIEELSGQTLLIRAHGEPPVTYRRCEAAGVTVVDATCPVVAKLQRTVREAYVKMEAVGGLVIILGKKGHPEVAGLTGQLEERAVVVESMEDLRALSSRISMSSLGGENGDVWSRPVYLLSQTTQSLVLFESVKNYILERCPQATIHDTICRQVSNRNPHLAEFAARFDVIIFVSGKKSSNGKALYEVCRDVNEHTYFVEEPSDLDPAWFTGQGSVGICGATSTPKWVMEDVAAHIAKF